VGFLSYAVELSAIYFFKDILNISSTSAVAFAFWIGLGVSFILQKFATFQNKDTSIHSTSNQIISYGALVFINYIFTLGFVELFSPIVGVYAARTVALGITTIWNFFVYKRIIFSDKEYISKKLAYRFGVNLILLLPVLIFCTPMLLSGFNNVFPGDFDMQVQMTEAARITIQEYGQFPLWNPWVSGGVPLFADPQFNILSPSLFLSFFVESSFAWKLTIFIYLIIGFFGMKKLLRYISNNEVTSILFAYIWIFSSFFTLRAMGGHFTFLNLLLLPLFIYLLLNLNRSRKYVIYLCLLTAYLIYSAVHYSLIFILLAVGLLAIIQTANYVYNKQWREGKQYIISMIVALLGGILLALPRIIASLEYLASNKVTRLENPELFIGLSSGISTLIVPFQNLIIPRSSFGAFEASSYIGLLTMLVIVVSFSAYLFLYFKKRSGFSVPVAIQFTLISIPLSFLIGLGGAPFNELHKLPVFSSMRVSTRFFVLTAFSLLLLGAYCYSKLIEKKLTGKHSIKIFIYFLLLVASTEVFVSNINLNRLLWQKPLQISEPRKAYGNNDAPRSEKRWNADTQRPYVNHALTLATRNHHAQLLADNALVNTDDSATEKCDEDEPSCSFIRTRNAKLLYWSPNRIIIKRTSTGPIELNMNVSKYWVVNGRSYPSPLAATINPVDKFIINDETQKLDVRYAPKFSYNWFLNRVTN
jgi:putative flippase GtrA